MEKQQQITISAYEMEVIQKAFTNTLRWLEFYIEKSGYYRNWHRQIPEIIKRQDLNQPSEIKRFMETALLALDGLDKPKFISEGLKEQFYSWLEKSGIKTGNCSKKLAECLINIEKVLNNEGKEFGEEVDREASESIAKMSQEERRQKFRQTLTASQKMMEVASERKKGLEGKTYRDVNIENQFAGNSERGQSVLEQIKSQLESRSQLHQLPWGWYDENYTAIVAKENEAEVIYESDERGEFAKELNQSEKEAIDNLITERQQELVRKETDRGELYAVVGGSTAVLIFSSAVWLFKRYQR